MANTPERITLDAHLRTAAFLTGVDEGRWAVQETAFPDIYVWVQGRDPETGATEKHDFHLKCDNYPEVGPFVERWDYTRRCRPPAPSEGSPGFLDAMKDWNEGNAHGGIYRAWQRLASAHSEWAKKRPDQSWHRGREISSIMEELYALVSEQACWLAGRS
jgi:hypothetical protein